MGNWANTNLCDMGDVLLTWNLSSAERMGPENEAAGETVLGKALSWEWAERAKAGDRDEGSRGTSHMT